MRCLLETKESSCKEEPAKEPSGHIKPKHHPATSKPGFWLYRLTAADVSWVKSIP